MKRKGLIAGSLGALLAARAPAVVAQDMQTDTQRLSRNSGGLVLPGGGARGAYEAGVIEGVRQAAGVSDGAPLPGIDAVTGTSIGSINGWFVATAQYSLLKKVWRSIADEQIFVVKPQYRAATVPSSGVVTRVLQGALVAQGLTTNVTGLLDGSRVHAWLKRNVDPTVPVIVPFAFTLTNLDHQRSEIFARLPFEPSAHSTATAAKRIQSVFGQRIAIRQIEDEHLVSALAGSSAIPIVFDPVTIDFPEGPQTYIDGGVADSAPLDLARVLSRRVRLVLVDPAEAAVATYPNAAAVGSVAFSIAQNRILDASLRGAHLETLGKRLFEKTAMTREQAAFFQDIFDVEISLIRPERELEVAVQGFDDAAGIRKTYDLGVVAGYKGFVPYDPGVLLRDRKGSG